jgi:hypothetical protein
MTTRAAICLSGLLILAPALYAQDGADDVATGTDEEYQQLTANALPPLILNAARAAAPDVFFDSAESYLQDDFRVYRVSGRLFREVWHVYVREDGKVLRAKSDIQDD